MKTRAAKLNADLHAQPIGELYQAEGVEEVPWLSHAGCVGCGLALQGWSGAGPDGNDGEVADAELRADCSCTGGIRLARRMDDVQQASGDNE